MGRLRGYEPPRRLFIGKKCDALEYVKLISCSKCARLCLDDEVTVGDSSATDGIRMVSNYAADQTQRDDAKVTVAGIRA